MNKPVLLYDGECDFCQYCVDYFKLRTGDQVRYQAYQDGTLGRPKQGCQQAIQFIIDDHTFYEGAAAAFCALSYGHNNRSWWLYKNVPGMSWLTEKLYLYISHHRRFCYKMAKMVCGDPWQLGRLTIISWGFIFFMTITLLALKNF